MAISKLFFFLFSLGFPILAYASDMSGLIIVFSVPLGVICFVSAYYIAHKTGSRRRMGIIIIIQIPNWFMIGLAIKVGASANSIADQIIFIGVHTALLFMSFIPVFVYRKRLRKRHA